MPPNNKQKLLELGFDVIEHTDAMLSYWDENLICRFANNAYMHWYGKKPEDMINKMHIRDLLGPLFEANLVHIEAVLGGKVEIFEQHMSIPNGKTKNVRITYFPNNESGKTKGFYAHAVDISPLSSFSQIGNDDSFNTANNYISTAGDVLEEVVKTLKSCILTSFPGIPSLSKKHFISESKLKRDFKQKYNTTIFNYYRYLQMELAHKYITEKKSSKGQMAVIFNFSNPSNFFACYKKFLSEKSTKQTNNDSQKENNWHQTLVEQTPAAIAMLDTKMKFIAVSQKWIQDNKLQNKEISGKSIYEIIPKIRLKHVEILNSCLSGAISIAETEFSENENGAVFWLHWTVKPWYTKAEQIGGLLIYAEDITSMKLNDNDDKIISEILNSTNEIMQVGAWTRDFVTNTTIWSKTLKQILEVPDDFNPDLATAFSFYKEGASRDLATKGFNDTFKNGTRFDIEVDMVTAKGRTIRARLIGYPDFEDGKCSRISGVFHVLLNPPPEILPG